jgi:hypothetical protein
MVACVELPLGPACIDLTGLLANDRNMFAAHLHVGSTPVDLTGLTLTAQARLTAIAADPPVLTAVVNIVAPLTGDITVSWPGSQVATALGTAAKWRGVWDLQADNGVDDPQTLMGGKIAASWDVTR